MSGRAEKYGFYAKPNIGYIKPERGTTCAAL